LREERDHQAEHMLATIGEVLGNADGMLDELEDNEMLGSALVRCCQDLADGMDDLASQLDQQSEEERRALAQAVQHDLLLHEQHHGTLIQEKPTTDDNTTSTFQQNRELSTMSTMSEDDMLQALSGAQALLVDVAEALRSIDRQESDEIADVALTVARLFIASLQSIHATITPGDIVVGPPTESDRVEFLGESSNNDSSSSTIKNRKHLKNHDRIRCLWPPLGPSVASTCQWGKEEAAKRPILAVALGLALWPAAIVTALMGTPVVLVDGALQNAYANFSDGSLGEQLERGAAEVYHAGRLSFICGKLVLKQTSRVMSRQIKRHGGVGKIAHNAVDLAVNRACHPVKTVEMVWNSIAWSAGVVKDASMIVHDAVTRQMGESDGEQLYMD